MTTERDFKGVWVPKDIWLSEELGWSEKLLFVEIDSLAKNGECFASNDYFAKFFGLSKDRISKMVTSLKRKSFISVELVYKPGSKEIDKRIIRTNVIQPIGENADTPRQKRLDPLVENAERGIGENAYDNNTYINNTVNNTTNIKDKKTNKKENSPVVEGEFEDLWKLYPRKIGKKKAFDAFKKARKIKKIPYETIENGLYRYIRYLEQQETDEQYIMHGSTWFSQEKWQDEYILTGIKKKPKSMNEYMRQKYGDDGGQAYEPQRDRKIVNDYDEFIPDIFQTF
jgi:hypothetical protein